MRVLIDTNVVMDYILKREPYAKNAYRIVQMCVNKEIDGCIAAHTVTNLFFILRKNLSVSERKAVLLKLCRVFTVVGLDISKLISPLVNNKLDDLVGCLQDECANEFQVDYLITRNLDDFVHGKVKAVKPDEFLKLLKE